MSQVSVLSSETSDVICCQEIKMSKTGMLQLNGYQIFEKLRQDKSGGGLLTAVDMNLNPVMLAGNDSHEILTIELCLPIGKLRVINAYGPQEYDQTEKRQTFWLALEEEVIKANNNGCFCLIEMDKNAKIGNIYYS